MSRLLTAVDLVRIVHTVVVSIAIKVCSDVVSVLTDKKVIYIKITTIIMQ